MRCAAASELVPLRMSAEATGPWLDSVAMSDDCLERRFRTCFCGKIRIDSETENLVPDDMLVKHKNGIDNPVNILLD